jgi:hypothetical protein
VVSGRAIGFGTVALALAVVAAACQFIEGIQTRISPAPPDAAIAADAAPPLDSAVSVADAAEAGCTVVPPPPTQGDPGGNLTVVMAVQAFYYDQPDSGPALGFNLDCVDTCPGPPSCQSKNQHCDEDGGRDLAGNTLLSLIDTYGSATGQGDINGRIASGIYTMLVEMTGWNGSPDDPSVSLAVYVSSGIIADPEAGTTTPPKWDGTDVWEVDPRTANYSRLGDGGYVYVPKAVTTSAYISNNKVIATLPGLQFGVGVGVFAMTGIAFVGDLVPVLTLGPNGGYRLQGQLAGRVSVPAILGIASLFKDPTDPTRQSYICGSDVLAVDLLSNLCGAADIMSDPSMDNATPLANCDALSAGIGLTAVSANLGYPYKGLTVVAGCDGSVQDCNSDGG